MITGDPIYDQFYAACTEATGRPASELRSTVPGDDGTVWGLIVRSMRDRDEQAWEQLRPIAVQLLERRALITGLVDDYAINAHEDVRGLDPDADVVLWAQHVHSQDGEHYVVGTILAGEFESGFVRTDEARADLVRLHLLGEPDGVPVRAKRRQLLAVDEHDAIVPL